MKIVPPFQRAWEAKKYRPNDVAAMLRRSEGRTLVELCLLVGRKAEVRFSDYGCSGTRIGWSERVTITEFLGPRPMEIYDGEGYFVKSVLVPTFGVTCIGNGMANIPLCNLENIQTPDRVCRQCDTCRHDAPAHQPGCPTVQTDEQAAYRCWQDGWAEFRKWNGKFKPDGWDTFLYSNPTFLLGYQAAEEEERKFRADYDMPSYRY